MARREHRAWIAAALTCATAVGGCADVPPSPFVETSYDASAAIGAPYGDWPSQSWWTVFGDPDLSNLVEAALAGAPTIAVAEARLRRAEAVSELSRASLSPTAAAAGVVQDAKQSYNVGIPPQFVPQGYNDVGAVKLTFGWELDFWGKNRAALAAATSEARAASADAAEARLIISTAVAQAYTDLAALYRTRDIAARALELRTETAELVRQRVDNGLDTQGELSLAAAQPLVARAELNGVDEQIALGRNRLAALLGGGPDQGLKIARPKMSRYRTAGPPPNLPADLVGRRPDVVAARWRVEATTSRTKEARAAFYPNVNIAGFLGYEALGLNNLFASGSDNGAIGPALSLPIFDGGRLKADRRRADAERDVAVAAYQGAVVEALHEVADAVASSRALVARLADAQAASAAEEAAYRSTRLRYEGGLNTYQAVLLAEQQLLAQRRAVVDLESRGASLEIALIRALGGGYFSQPSALSKANGGDKQRPSAGRG